MYASEVTTASAVSPSPTKTLLSRAGFDWVLIVGGFYAGTWASDDLGDVSWRQMATSASLELDYSAGAFIGENSAIDVGYMYYDYPGEVDEGDYQEINRHGGLALYQCQLQHW